MVFEMFDVIGKINKMKPGAEVRNESDVENGQSNRILSRLSVGYNSRSRFISAWGDFECGVKEEFNLIIKLLDVYSNKS